MFGLDLQPISYTYFPQWETVPAGADWHGGCMEQDGMGLACNPISVLSTLQLRNPYMCHPRHNQRRRPHLWHIPNSRIPNATASRYHPAADPSCGGAATSNRQP